uniref:Uncharacterized protein n=1 Tax=Acrobeloides nanus TaxID=290746 RepID=A0A914C268_9BILA
MLLLYLLHGLTYIPSAFSWLFYASLNRNLQYASRCALGPHSEFTSTHDEPAHTASETASNLPLMERSTIHER